MFERGATARYDEQQSVLRQQLRSAVPADVLAALDNDAVNLGKVDYAGRAVRPGAVAPDFTLADQTGTEVTLSTLLGSGPVVLTFYRGTWCPYCNLALRTFQAVLPQFTAAGATLVAVSPQTPDNSLSMAQRHELGFTVLSDPGNATARAFGLEFTVDATMRDTMLHAGTDLTAHNGLGSEEPWLLPVPATFVIAPNGVVVAGWVDGDYRNRAEPAAVLDVLSTIARPPQHTA